MENFFHKIMSMIPGKYLTNLRMFRIDLYIIAKPVMRLSITLPAYLEIHSIRKFMSTICSSSDVHEFQMVVCCFWRIKLNFSGLRTLFSSLIWIDYMNTLGLMESWILEDYEISPNFFSTVHCEKMKNWKVDRFSLE